MILAFALVAYAKGASAAQAEAQMRVATIPDLPVLDQNGREVHFYSDLLKGKVAVINLIYTSCPGFCSLQGEHFSRLEKYLKKRLGKDVSLISITTDPGVDTPERLKAWGKRFDIKPGWTMITGDKANIEAILKSLTGGITRQGLHTPLVFIGSGDKGIWAREYGLAEPERLVSIIDEIGRALPD